MRYSDGEYPDMGTSSDPCNCEIKKQVKGSIDKKKIRNFQMCNVVLLLLVLSNFFQKYYCFYIFQVGTVIFDNLNKFQDANHFFSVYQDIFILLW